MWEQHERHPVPYLTDFKAQVAGTRIYTKINPIKANYNIHEAEEVIPKKRVITPIGPFEFLRLLFGLRNAAQTF